MLEIQSTTNLLEMHF